MTARAMLLALATLAAACGAGQQWTASRDEYRLYRTSRVAPTEEQRLGAANEYLRRYPDGVYRERVRDYFVPAEEAYFYGSRDSLPKLRAYLAAMPSGPHAKAVASRIVELESTRAAYQRRDQRFLEKAERIESTLAGAAESRRVFLAEVTEWSRLLAGIRSFGEPTSRLHHELIYRFRLTEPHGVCTADRCHKPIALDFAIPDAGKLRKRNVSGSVELELDASGLVRARFTANGLMSRVGEAVELRPVAGDDLQARAEAIARAVTVFSAAVEPELPEARCGRTPVSPVVLLRECDGVRLSLVAATSSEERDALVVEALPRAP